MLTTVKTSKQLSQIPSKDIIMAKELKEGTVLWCLIKERLSKMRKKLQKRKRNSKIENTITKGNKNHYRAQKQNWTGWRKKQQIKIKVDRDYAIWKNRGDKKDEGKMNRA